jgi:hypothetical protein
MTLHQPVGPVVFSYTVGSALVYIHGLVARRLWGAKLPDLISMIASTGGPPSGNPDWHKVVHILLMHLKVLGLIFLAGGAYGTGEWVWEFFTGHGY